MPDFKNSVFTTPKLRRRNLAYCQIFQSGQERFLTMLNAYASARQGRFLKQIQNKDGTVFLQGRLRQDRDRFLKGISIPADRIYRVIVQMLCQRRIETYWNYNDSSLWDEKGRKIWRRSGTNGDVLRQKIRLIVTKRDVKSQRPIETY